MKTTIIIILTSMLLGCKGKTVKFLLPTEKNSLSTSSSESTSSQSDSSEIEYANIKSEDKDGSKFENLRKDDDLISMRRKRGGSRNKKNRIALSSTKGGKQTVGFIYNRTWHRDAASKFEKSANNGAKWELNEGIVKEPVNAGWWLFSFDGGNRAVSKTQFQFKTSLPVRVTLVDLFCRGDSFTVWNSGKLIAQSSRIRGDEECGEVMFGPQEALADGRWSSVVFDLEQGEHSIEMRTVDNVIDAGGVAAIKFEHILPTGSRGARVSRNKVCRGYNGLIVVDTLVPSTEAKSVCFGFGTELARVALDEESWRSIKTCLGGDGKVWAIDRVDNEIKSFGYKNAGNDEGIEMKAVLCRVDSKI